jgi:hypothetical protein
VTEEYKTPERRAVDPVIAEILSNQKEILSLMKGLVSAFPINEIGQPDFDGHRRSHAEMMRKDREFAETRRDAARKVVSAGTLGGATILLYALWDYIKAHIK